MNIPTSDFELIQKYLSDNMSENDLVVFKRKSRYKEFRSELLLGVSVLKNISDHRKSQLMDKLEYQNLIDSFNTRIDTSQIDSIKSKKGAKWVAIILFLVTMSFVSYHIINKANKPLPNFASNYILDTKLNTQLGVSDRGLLSVEIEAKANQLKNDIQEAIANGEFKQAVVLFDQYEALTTLDVEEKYFLAASILKSNSPEVNRAIILLNEVVEHNNAYKAEALWLRGLAFGIINDMENMKNDLLRLQSESRYQHENILIILEQIDISN